MPNCRYRPMALLLLALHVGACTRWELATVSPRVLLEEERPSEVQVIHSDGRRSRVSDPVISRDSIGSTRGCPRVLMPDGRAVCAAPTLMIALADVQGLEVRRTGASGAVWYIVVPLAVVGLVLAGLQLQELGDMY